MRNIILAVIAFTSWFTIMAQDLIQDTQNNVPSNTEDVDTNLIYKNIVDVFKNSTYSKVAPFVLNKQTEHHLEHYKEIVSKAFFLNSRLRVINQLHSSKPENLKLSIPVGRGRNVELLLSKKDILISDFDLTTSSESTFSLDQQEGLFYHGVVSNHPGSIAAVSIFTNSIRILISDQKGNYVLSSIENDEEFRKKGNNLFVFYNDYDLLVDFDPVCNIKIPNQGSTNGCTNAIPDSPPLNHFVEVFLECEYNIFDLQYGSSEFETFRQISSTFNEASIIFSMEQMEIKLAELHIINDQ